MKIKKITKVIFNEKNRMKFFLSSGLVVAFLIFTSAAAGSLGRYLDTFLGGPGSGAVGPGSGTVGPGSGLAGPGSGAVGPGSGGTVMKPGNAIAGSPAGSLGAVTSDTTTNNTKTEKTSPPMGPVTTPSGKIISPQKLAEIKTQAETKPDGGVFSKIIAKITGESPLANSVASGTRSTPATTPTTTAGSGGTAGTTVKMGSGTSGNTDLDKVLSDEGVLEDYNIVGSSTKDDYSCLGAEGCIVVGYVKDKSDGSGLDYVSNHAYGSNETHGVDGWAGPSAEELAAMGYTLSYEDTVLTPGDEDWKVFGVGSVEYAVVRQYYVTDASGKTYALDPAEKNYWDGYEIADGSSTWINNNMNTDSEMSLSTSGSPGTEKLTTYGFTDLREESGDYVVSGPDGKTYTLEPSEGGLVPYYTVVDSSGKPYQIENLAANGPATADLVILLDHTKSSVAISDADAKSSSSESSSASTTTSASASTSSTSTTSTANISALTTKVHSTFPRFSLSDVSNAEKAYISGSPGSGGNDINGDGKFTYADVISLVQCWNNSECRGGL